MLIIDWVMDKLGYTKKVYFSWEDFLCEKPAKPKRKIATKKPAVKKTVRKKV